MPVYAEFGVHHLWLLDPLARTLEGFRLETGKWLLLSIHGEAERVRAEPFDELEIELSLLWA
jgi:Uma2 family endonuclease